MFSFFKIKNCLIQLSINFWHDFHVECHWARSPCKKDKSMLPIATYIIQGEFFYSSTSDFYLRGNIPINMAPETLRFWVTGC